MVPTDFSSLAEEALEYAAYLAEVVKADITALHIVESGTFESDSKENDGQKERIHRLEQLWQELQKRRPIDPSIQFRARLKEGKIQDQILETALEEQSDLIVMGTHGRSGINPLSRFFLGSTANRLTQASPVPVLSLRGLPKPLQLKEILLPLDLTKQTQRKVLFAVNLARLFGSRLNLVAVSDYFETLRGKASTLENLMEEQAVFIREAGIEVTTEVIRHDDVAHSVVGYADEISADLIIIVTAQESNIDSLLMGSRAGRVIATSQRPVLSIRPRNLESMLQHT